MINCGSSCLRVLVASIFGLSVIHECQLEGGNGLDIESTCMDALPTALLLQSNKAVLDQP